MSRKERPFSRKIDTFAGIPLLFALSGLGPGRAGKLPERVLRAAFLRIDSPRDTLLTEGAARAFKKRYPGAELVYFAGSGNYDAASLIPSVDETALIYPDDMRKSASVVKSAGFFDIWVDFGPWSRFESILTFFAKAKFKIGFRTEGEYRHFAYDAVSDLNPKKHLCENISSLMKLAGVFSCGLPRFAAHDTAEKGLVIFNMFPDKPEHAARKWGEENWKYLLSRLSKKGYKIAITGKKSDSGEADGFTENIGDADIDYLVGRLEGPELLKALSRASLVVSVDSWILYAAAAMDVPSVGIYGPTSPEMYAPQGNNAVYITSGASCRGCQDVYGEKKCLLAEPVCMDSADCGAVEKAALEILEGRL